MIDRKKYNNLEDWDKDKLLSYISQDYTLIDESYKVTNKLIDDIINRDSICTDNIVTTMKRQIVDLCETIHKDRDKPEYMEIFRRNYIKFIDSLKNDLVDSRNADVEFLSSLVHKPNSDK